MGKKHNVWSIVEIDKYGKVKMGYKPITDLPVNETQTLSEFVEATELEISELKKEVVVLKQALGEVIKTFGGVEE